MTTYEWITTFLVPVTGIVSWLAGARMRRNESVKALQTTIDMLVQKNQELYDEIVRLRQENDTLRDQGIKRDNEIAELKLELERMKK
jgi:cell division protein FtsB